MPKGSGRCEMAGLHCGRGSDGEPTLNPRTVIAQRRMLRRGVWLACHGSVGCHLARLPSQRLEKTRNYSSDKTDGRNTMKVAVSGASGLVGSALVEELKRWGHEVLRLVRQEDVAADAVLWDYEQGICEAERLEGCDAIIHLAGDNVASGRWTTAKKQRIRDSRVIGTGFLARKVAALANPPKVFVCASAIGFYGDRGDDRLEEQAAPGSGFLSSVVQEWEEATKPLTKIGVRVVNLRIGLVLSGNGGALKRMLLPFRLGVGGVVGSGQQFISWIAIDDVIGAIHHCMTTESLSGPVNAVAPNPVTNHDFTKALGQTLHRPTVLPMPAFAVRLAFGEMGDELLLSSTRVVPTKLQASGYQFQAEEILSALQLVL